MYVPDGQVVALLPTQQDVMIFWTGFLGLITLPGYIFLLISLLLLYFKVIKNNQAAFLPSIKYLLFAAVLANLYLLLSSITSLFMQQSLPLTSIPILILFVLFPVVFTVNLAWKNEISLYIRYLIILSYFICISSFMVIAMPFLLEQLIFAGKLCFGITCPPPNHPIIFTPASYRDLIHK